jgi:acyl-CoA thioester hydrolase
LPADNPAGDNQAGPVLPAPFLSQPRPVRPEWIDHNGHLNLAYYIVLFDEATDALWQAIGVGEAYRARSGCATFAAESHTLYMAELLLGDETTAHSLVLDVDAKRLHVAHELRRNHDDVVAARQELMFLNVDLATRRSAPWPAATLASLRDARDAHAAVRRPEWVGRRIAMPTR